MERLSQPRVLKDLPVAAGFPSSTRWLETHSCRAGIVLLGQGATVSAFQGHKNEGYPIKILGKAVELPEKQLLSGNTFLLGDSLMAYPVPTAT